MTKNQNVYPDDFSFEQAKKSEGFATIDDAYRALEIQARDTALRQVNSRRIALASAITAGHRSVRTSPGPIPVHRVGKKATPQPFLGSAAYTGGRNEHAAGSDSFWQFPFSNEILIPLTARLTFSGVYQSAISNLESAKFAGGISVAVTASDVIDKLTYLKLQIERVAETLDRAVAGTIGGMGNNAFGLWVGGVRLTELFNSCTRYNHSTNTKTVFNNFLASPRYAPHNGLSSPVNGYVWAGLTRFLSGNIINSIDRIPYSTLATTPTSSALSNFGDLTPPQAYHASLSAPTRGFIVGGHTLGVNSLTPVTSAIKIFDFSTEMVSNSNNALDEPVTCLQGAGHSQAGFTFGGNNVSEGKIYWYGTKKIRKLNYSSTLNFIIGQQLIVNMSDQATTSDYSPSLY